MRLTEMALLAGAGAAVTLRPPAARAAAGRMLVGAGRTAAPAAARAGRATLNRSRTIRRRLTAAAPGVSPCVMADCDWTQTGPSSAGLLAHIHRAHGVRSPRTPDPPTRPAPGSARPGPGSAEVRTPRPEPRPAERVDEVAPGVLISRNISQVIEKIGLHMDEFRAVTRALNAAGEIKPGSLLQLLDTLSGVLTTLAGTANMITDIAEHVDLEMWVDLRAVAPLYESAAGVMAESEAVRQAMQRLRTLYAEEIEVEHKQAEQTVRTLNPMVKAA